MFLLVASDPVLSRVTVPLFDYHVAMATVAASKQTAGCLLLLSPLSLSTEGRGSCNLPRCAKTQTTKALRAPCGRNSAMLTDANLVVPPCARFYCLPAV